MDRACRLCEFWDRNRAWGEKKDKAACRALPPLIRSNAMACDADAHWPTTTADQWCGSFVKREQ